MWLQALVQRTGARTGGVDIWFWCGTATLAYAVGADSFGSIKYRQCLPLALEGVCFTHYLSVSKGGCTRGLWLCRACVLDGVNPAVSSMYSQEDGTISSTFVLLRGAF